MILAKVTVKKFGQITIVSVNGKLSYKSGNTPKAEVKNLEALLNSLFNGMQKDQYWEVEEEKKDGE